MGRAEIEKIRRDEKVKRENSGMVGWMGSLAGMEEMQVLFAVSPLRW